MKLPEGIGFTADSFDELRKVLHAHLGDVLPERDHRDLIINLIEDIKDVARDEGNKKLPALFEAWITTLPLYNYCEDCKEWVKPGVMVCNYRGKTASFI